MRRITYFLLIAVFLIIPVGATSSSHADVEYIQKSNFWTWAAGEPGTGWNKFIGYTFGVSCPNSEDGYHHASSYRRPEASWGGPTGYYKCICDLCGAEFTAYEKDLQQSYEAQVEELPAQSITAAGKLIWQTTWDDYYFSASDTCTTISFTIGNSATSVSRDSLSSGLKFGTTSVLVSVVSPTTLFLSWGNGYCSRGIALASNYLKAPVSGYYCIDNGFLIYSMEYLDSDTEVIKSHTLSTNSSYRPLSKCYVSAGDWISIRTVQPPYLPASGNYTNFHREYLYAYSISIELDTFGPISGTTYNINSRPTSITGDYGIIGDNGQIIKVEGDKIVNETNNTIYNPATGETHTMSDWSYNYEDRSYTVTTETGDTITITYGDENVTIKEGDTIYNVYYLVDGSGEPGPDVPGGCNHIWTETGRTEPACTTAGKVTSTCSKCNQTKTETIPATGHNWVVDRTVQTTYDEEGNLLQQGYTIYSCSVCGEQYKDSEGTGPPGTPGGSGGDGEKSIWEKIGEFFGTIGGGFLEIIGAVAGKLLDALTKLAEMLLGKIKTVVETVLTIFDEVPALFGGFLDFLAAIFPFLPPEITSILTFGVIAITFIGILKAVRR